MKKALFGMVTVILVTACIALAQSPVVNISKRHGNLRDAQSLIVEAFDRISVAQSDNNGHMGGHAARAKELLREADSELRQAANDLR